MAKSKKQELEYKIPEECFYDLKKTPDIKVYIDMLDSYRTVDELLDIFKKMYDIMSGDSIIYKKYKKLPEWRVDMTKNFILGEWEIISTNDRDTAAVYAGILKRQLKLLFTDLKIL